MSRETDIQRCQQRIALHTDSFTDPWPQQRAGGHPVGHSDIPLDVYETLLTVVTGQIRELRGAPVSPYSIAGIQRLKPAAHWLLEQGGQPHE